jgi:YggT family protein
MNVSSALFASILELMYTLLRMYVWVLIVGAVLSWLVAFNIINARNRFVQVVGDFIYRITEPLLKPIRRLLPHMGGMDLSPLVLILIIWFIQSFIRKLAV